MNQPTPFINGTERLTKKLDMPAVYLDITRMKRGHYNLNVVLMAEETKKIPDWQLTQQYAELLEASIRRQPPYWLWSHNRWKRKPEDFYNAVAKDKQQDTQASNGKG